MKTAVLPEQIVGPLSVRLTVGKSFTVMVIVPEVAGEPAKHGVALLVITTLTTSLLDKVEVAKVAVATPITAVPLTNH